MNTHTIRKILVPIDFSESSLNALETAIAIGLKSDACIVITHVRDNTLDLQVANPSLPFNKQLDNSEEILNALVDTVKNKTGKNSQLIIELGSVSASIVKVADKQACDLIVMGTHGASGYRDFFIGTNTYNVIKYANCPVLTIPTKKKYKDFKNIFFPVKPLHGSLKKYDFVRDMTASGTVALHVHCLLPRRNDDDEQLIAYLIDELKERLNGEPVNISSEFSIGNNIEEIILKTADQLRADLILLTPSIDITNKQYFIGPYTQRILHQAKVPVLTIKRTN